MNTQTHQQNSAAKDNEQRTTDHGQPTASPKETITQDIGSDNLAATDGWYVRSSEASNSSSYLTSTHVSPNRNATYHDVSNDGPKTESAPLLQFAIDNNFLDGKTLRVGVLFDVYYGSGNTWTYTLKQTVGGSVSATSSLLALNDTAGDGSKLDIAHFDITDVAPGDTFVITATPGVVPTWPGPFEPVWGMTFDSALSPLFWDGGNGIWTDDKWNTNGPWVPTAPVTFNTSGDQTITLDGAITAASLTFTGDGDYTIQDDGGDSLTVTGETSVGSNVSVTVTADTVDAADIDVSGSLILGENSALTADAVTVAAGGVLGGYGSITATTVSFDNTAGFWVDPNGPIAFGGTEVLVGNLDLLDLDFAPGSLAKGKTYVLMTGTNLDLSGIDFGFGTLTNGWEAQFINGSLELYIIPEPSTAILAGLGLMGVCFRRRRSAK